MIMIPERHGQTDRRTDGRLTVALPRSALASRGNNFQNSNQTQIHDIESRSEVQSSVFMLLSNVSTVMKISRFREWPSRAWACIWALACARISLRLFLLHRIPEYQLTTWHSDVMYVNKYG